MTGPPGLRALMRAGVRRSVATEYRRLIAAGVNPEAACLLARRPQPVDTGVDAAPVRGK